MTDFVDSAVRPTVTTGPIQGSSKVYRDVAGALAAAAAALGHPAWVPPDPANYDALCTAATDLPPTKRRKISE